MCGSSRRLSPVGTERRLAAGRWLPLLRTVFFIFIWIAGAIPLVPSRAGARGLPSLPQVTLDTAYAPPSGRTIAVRAGGDFQAALNSAKPGDLITLEAGAIFRGSFILPEKTGQGWIVIRTSAPDGDLPPPGTRVEPSYARVMPKLEAASGSAIATMPGAQHYRFIGVEVRPTEKTFLYNLIQLGSGETSVSELPHDIIFDRCYLHGDPAQGTRRGIAMNAASVAVIDSYLSDFKEVGNDSQALAGWNGPGPFKIVNNYLEGAAENLLFGGADSSIPNLVPSDIEIRQNHFVKPLAWRVGDPSYAGTHWSVKNLLELKNAQRVLIEGNILEYCWADGQVGFAVLFTPRNQSGGSPWSTVQDVTFRDNIVRHSASGVDILGYDDTYPSQQAQRILIQNNLFADVNGTTWNGDGRLFQVRNGAAAVTIDHNTAFQSGNIITTSGAPGTAFVFQNNLAPHNAYGVIGDTVGVGVPTLTTYFPQCVFRKNGLIGPYPTSGGATVSMYGDFVGANFFPQGIPDVGFVNYTGGNYQLSASSPYKNAGTDGKDLGADMAALNAATSGALSGISPSASGPSAPILVSVE